MIRTKRAYEPAAEQDGERILVDRVWPRGVSKDQLQLASWMRDLAPSTPLRKWFGHDPARWGEFVQRYREELAAPEKRPLLDALSQRAQHGTVTLIYGARDTEHNQAIALREMLEGRHASA